jgi:hypothetical protein
MHRSLGGYVDDIFEKNFFAMKRNVIHVKGVLDDTSFMKDFTDFFHFESFSPEGGVVQDKLFEFELQIGQGAVEFFGAMDIVFVNVVQVQVGSHNVHQFVARKLGMNT